MNVLKSFEVDDNCEKVHLESYKHNNKNSPIKHLENIQNNEYTSDHTKEAIEIITSQHLYKFTYHNDLMQSVVNKVCPWNFQNLNDLISCMTARNVFVGGFVNPFLYFNTNGTIFCFHRDNIGAGVINLNAFGKPVIWYLIPPQNVKIFMIYLYRNGTDKCINVFDHIDIFFDIYKAAEEISKINLN